MHKYFLQYIGILLILFYSCQNSLNLNKDKNLSSIFTRNEIKEIEKMVAYVDEMVKRETGSTDIDQAYHLYFRMIGKFMNDSSRLPQPFEEEKKYAFLESLDSAVYDAFWHTDGHVKAVIYQDSIYRDLKNFKSLDYSRGRYLEYLAKVAENEKFFKEIHEVMDISGDLTYTMIRWYTSTEQKFDFTMPPYRLWAAVYILRMEDHIDNKMKRYLNH